MSGLREQYYFLLAVVSTYGSCGNHFSVLISEQVSPVVQSIGEAGSETAVNFPPRMNTPSCLVDVSPLQVQ